MELSSSFATDLLAAISAYDRRRALDLVMKSLDGGAVSIRNVHDVLSDLLVNVGASWQKGSAEVWEEHLVTGIVRSVVEAVGPRVENAAPEVREATVVLAAPEDEYHDLGLRMLADRFTLSGWRAHFLGASLPASELVRAADDLGANAVALSASTHYHRVGLRHYVTELAEARPELRIWVGGPAFAVESEGWPAEMILDPRVIPQPGQF